MNELRPLTGGMPTKASGERLSSPVYRAPAEFGEATGKPVAVLTTMTLLGVIYTASIGGGYGLEDSVGAGGPLLTIIFLLVIPLVWGIPVSMCVAELACSVPSNAGPIMWINVSFPSWFTLTNVMWTMMLNFVDNSIYPTLFADYTASLFDVDHTTKMWIKIVFLWSCTIINLLGAEVVGSFSLLIMVVTVAPFLVIFGLQATSEVGIDWARVAYVPKHIDWALFLPVISWNFCGFDSAGHVIEEVINPTKTFIRALLLMILAALATYIPPILAGVSAHSLRHVALSKWTDGFWVNVGTAVGGRYVGMLVLVGGTVSSLGLMVTLLAVTSRSLAGMGSINAFPRPLSRFLAAYNGRTGTPVNAILVNSAVTCVLSVLCTFQTLVTVDQVLYCLRLTAILVCFLRLRLRFPLLPRPFAAPGGTFAAVLWAGVPIAFSLLILVVSMLGSREMTLTTMCIVFGTMAASVVATTVFRASGFEGAIVEQYEDSDFATYGTLNPALHGHAGEHLADTHPAAILMHGSPSRPSES